MSGIVILSSQGGPPEIELPAVVPAIPPVDSDFQMDGERELGIVYRVEESSIVGYDPERLELGNIRAQINGNNVRQAKRVLMWNLTSGLTLAQRERRIHLV